MDQALPETELLTSAGAPLPAVPQRTTARREMAQCQSEIGPCGWHGELRRGMSHAISLAWWLVIQQFVDRKAGYIRQNLQLLGRGQDFPGHPIRNGRLTYLAASGQLTLLSAGVCEVLLEPLHVANIGESDIVSIGQTYIDLPQTRQVSKKTELTTFWDRLQTAMKDAARDGRMYRGERIKPTQVFAAKMAGVSQPTISEVWKQPGRGPELETGIKLAVQLDVCVDWLYTGRGPKRGTPLDPLAEQLLELWPQLSEGEKGFLLGHASSHTEKPTDPDQPPPFSRNDKHRGQDSGAKS